MKYALNRDDLAAMKLANDVTFHHNADEFGEGVTQVRLHKRFDYETPSVRMYRLFPDLKWNDSTERMRVFHVEGMVSDFSPMDEAEQAGYSKYTYNCFTMLHGAGYDRSWQTVVDGLKSGDEVAIRWVASNNSNVLREAGLHADEVRLLSVRPRNGSRPEQRREWLVDYRVCPDNVSRLVRKTPVICAYS
jgi:hypothetical protein